MTRCEECGIRFASAQGAADCAQLDREIAEKLGRIIHKTPQPPDPFIDEKALADGKRMSKIETYSSLEEFFE